jgi:hypothetical protein
MASSGKSALGLYRFTSNLNDEAIQSIVQSDITDMIPVIERISATDAVSVSKKTAVSAGTVTSMRMSEAKQTKQ